MQIQMTPQVADIMQQAENISINEKQNLFWLMLEKFGQENIISYQNIYISDSPSYIISFKMENAGNIKKKRKLGVFPEGTFVMSDDFNEPLDDFKEYMH